MKDFNPEIHDGKLVPFQPITELTGDMTIVLHPQEYKWARDKKQFVETKQSARGIYAKRDDVKIYVSTLVPKKQMFIVNGVL